MTSLAETIFAESDQQNAVDYMSGPKTITITKVGGPGGKVRQPIWIYFTGDDGRPWKPCKTMRRLLVAHWGDDGDSYVGRLVTIYRDPRVDFGEDKGCGGIRISHMSHIKTEDPIVLQTGKNKRASFRVQRLEAPKLVDSKTTNADLPPGDLTKALLSLENTATGEDRKNILKGLRAKFTWTDDEGKAIVAKITEMGKADRAQKTTTEPKNEDELP